MADDETDLDAEIARKKAQDAEKYLTDQLDQEDAGDNSGDLGQEETPRQAAALSSGPKRKTPNYVLTPVEAPAPPPMETRTDEQVTAPPPEMPKLETKTDEQVTGSALDLTNPDQLGATKLRGTSIPQAKRAELVDPDPDELYTDQQAPEVRRAAVVGTAPRATEVPRVAGEGSFGSLTEGPPGAPPADGTEDRPYWPKADKDIAALPSGTQYIDPKDHSQKVTPGTPRAQPATPPEAPVPVKPAPKARVSEFGYTPEEYKSAASGELTTTQPTTAADTGDQPPMLNAPNGKPPAALIIHHTSGNNSAESVVNDWRTNRPGVGAQMIMDRDGTIHNTQQEFGYNGTGNFLHSVIPGVSNRTAVGIEVIAKDDADMTPAQLQSLQRLAGPKGPYANVPVFGHSQVSPSDRDNEGVRGVAAINEARQGQQPTAVASGGGNYITGRATTFGYKDQGDPGVGAPRLGQLSTNNKDLIGLAIPEGALRSFVSAHPADWRKARVEVVTQDGRSLMVPIVDLGPGDTSDKRGVITDFTQGLSNLVGNTGEQNFKLRIIPNAGPDVMRDPQAFADEQAAIKAGLVKAPPLPGKRKPGNYVLTPVSPAEQVSGETAAQFGNQGQRDNLSILADQTPNLGALIKRLDQPVDGVNDAVRKDYQAQVKKEATAYAQDYYQEPDPQKAYDRITSNVGPVEFTGEVLSKVVPNFGKADVSIARFMDSADEKRVKQFIDALGPNASADVKTQEMQRLVAASPEERGPLINSLLAHADPTATQAVGDPGNVLDSLNRITDKDYQAKRQAAITEKQNWVTKSLRTDPRLVGTPAEFVTQQLAALPKNVVEAMLPPGVRETAFYAEIYQDAKENFARDNPRMSPEELDQKANLSAIAQLVPQEVLMAAVGGKLGAVASRIENPVARVASSALAHTAIGAAAGGTQQLAANVVAGQSPLEGVPEAAGGGAIQSVPGGVVAGFHRAPVETQRPTEAPTEAPPPEAPPEPATGPHGAPIEGPRDSTLEEQTSEAQPPPQPPPAQAQPAFPSAAHAQVYQDLVSRGMDEARARDLVARAQGTSAADILTDVQTKMRTETEPPPEPVAPPQEASIHEPQMPEIDESVLNKQSEDLYRRHQAELDLAKEGVVPSDLRADEPAPEREIRSQEPQPVRDARDVQADVGREPATSGENVPPKLGRVQSTLDTKLSPEESIAFEPNREALKNAQPGTPEFTQAYRNLREKVISRFQPILDALGVRRLPDDYVSPDSGATHAFAAGRGMDDVPELHSHLNEGSADLGRVIDMGADPVDYVHSVVQEEIIHFMHSAAVRDEWAAKGGLHGTGKDAISYEVSQGAGLVRDAVKARDTYRANGDHKHADLIDHALLDSIRAYNSQAYPSEHAARARLDSLLSDRTGRGDANLHLMSAELVRQLTQAGAKEPLTESHFKSWWQKAGNFYKQALRGLINLYRKLGPRSALGKLELAKMIRAVRAKVDAIDKIVADEKITPADKRAISGPSPVLEKPRVPGGKSVRDTVTERLKSGVRWFGQTFKSGESAMLDHKETQPLALAMRRRPSLEQHFGQRVQIMQLADAFNAVSAKERPRVVKEFTDYVRAEQNKQPLPAIGADTQKIIAAGKNTLEQLGQISKELNVHVKTSDGKVRPMRLIGRDYFPRMISDDTRDIFNRRDNTRAAEFNALVDRQIAQGKVKSRDEFIDKFTNAVTPDPTSNGHFGNIEKAREANLPLDFYDFSPEALVKYANRSTSRLSQIGAFGQKLSNKGKDLFDHSIEAVQRAGHYSYEDKQTIINRIGEERKAEYAEREKTNLGKLSSLARTATSGAFLGNPITSMYNLIGGAGQNLTFGGPGAFAKTAAHFASIKGAMDSLKEARERNILKSNLSHILTDYDLVTNQGWATKGVQGFTSHMLNWGGQNLSEGLNRAFAMQQAKYILQKFARGYGQDNAATRSLSEMIKRRGVHDLSGLARERGTGPLTDEFLRQYVMDVHGSYGPAQSASHIFDSPTGKLLLQFQKWGANTQRMATREFLMPLAKAAKERRPADFAYHLMRNIGYLGAAVGTGGASQLAANFLRDKDPRKPSIGEIYTRFAHGDNWKALQYALQRAQDMVILSGFAGTAGNYSDLANQLTGSDPGGRVKDPLHPPVVSFFQPFQELIQGWHGEGGAAPSPKILDQFMQNILSAYRVGKQTLLTGTNAAGIKLKPGEEMAAQNDLSFLRARVKMFENENPEFKAKADLKGTQSMSFAGRSEFDPYKDRIQNALLTGHPEDANLAIADWLDRFPPGEQEGRRKAIQMSVAASSPIKPGGSYTLGSELKFLDWVKQNLPPEEGRKIFATAQTYAKTAIDTGIIGSSTLAKIAKIDYDKFVYTTPKAKVTVITPSGGPSLADQIRRDVAAKQVRVLQAH